MLDESNFEIVKVHLLSRKRQTIIVVCGVMLGIAMFIVMISFMKGVNRFVDNAMISSTPDIRIYKEVADSSPFLHHANAIIDELKKNESIDLVSPALSLQVFIDYGTVRLNAMIDGVDIKEEDRLFSLSNKMTEGKMKDLLKVKNSVLLGQGLARKLNVHPGALVTVHCPSGPPVQLRVVGTFQFGMGVVDNIKAIMNIGDVQQLLETTPGHITDIRVKLKDIGDAKKQARLIEKKYGYRAEDWGSSNSSIIATNRLRNILTYVVSFALLIVAGFGMYNIMNMTIASRLKEIAILKAQGFAGKDIMTIFLSQSLVIGVIGSLLGLLLGFFLSYLLSRVSFPQSDFISLKYLPVLFEAKYYGMGILFGVATTFFAGLMPSLKAAKLDPVEILRG